VWRTNLQVLDVHREIQATLAQSSEAEDDLESELMQLLVPEDALEQELKSLSVTAGEILIASWLQVTIYVKRPGDDHPKRCLTLCLFVCLLHRSAGSPRHYACHSSFLPKAVYYGTSTVNLHTCLLHTLLNEMLLLIFT
jgi:hypothetical protein